MGSPLRLFRFRANVDGTLGAFSGYMRSGFLQGFVAHGQVAATGEPFSSIVFERPTPWPDLHSATKEQLEETQVNRFLRDYKRETGEPLAEGFARGADPPDFSLTPPSGERMGLECTQLVIGNRIQAWDVVENLKRSLRGVNRATFRHLRGQTVYLTVNTPSGMPPAGNRGTQEVAEALEAFHPAPNDFEAMPEDLSASNIVQTFGDYTLTAVPEADFPGTPFVDFMGFDLAFAIQSDVRASDAWSVLGARVQEKDLPGSDAILVSCGAPVTRGLSFPSDDLAADLIIETAATAALPPTKHVDSVYLHSWRDERVIRLLPGTTGAQPPALGTEREPGGEPNA